MLKVKYIYKELMNDILLLVIWIGKIVVMIIYEKNVNKKLMLIKNCMCVENVCEICE